MLRMLTTLILLISLLVGSLHAGHDLAGGDAHHSGGCSLSSACATPDHPCHDQGTSHSDHCCGSHAQQQAISVHTISFSPPLLEKQFTAVVPHLVPQDYSRIPFIPPRTTS
jgi:hypothetical protein